MTPEPTIEDVVAGYDDQELLDELRAITIAHQVIQAEVLRRHLNSTSPRGFTPPPDPRDRTAPVRSQVGPA